jgi:drug/metabolite transporter (DMT)-like permease
MPDTYLGEISALLASICFSIGPVFNTLAGSRISVGAVNRVRLLSTFTALFFIHWYLLGSPFPDLSFTRQWLLLGLSGIFGMVLGDTLLFVAFGLIGTRLAMLVATLIPVLSTLFAWLLLNERLSPMQLIGIMVVIFGVGFVLLDRNNGPQQNGGVQQFRKGLLVALGAALLHTFGAISAKAGLNSEFPALSAHMIRITISMIVVIGLAVVQGKVRRTIDQVKADPLALRYILLGALFGPLIGMWLNLFSIQNIPVGIATALTSLPPVWLLPIGRLVFKERIGWQAVAGSLVAVIGVAIIFLM